jgi:hypothetical protein
MTTDELEKLMVQMPVGLLHRLAHGRVHRHFRLGKRKLIEALLRCAPENRPGLESDVQALLEDARKGGRQETPLDRQGNPRISSPARDPGVPAQTTASGGAGPDEPAVDLEAFLEGIGVPTPQPFVPDAWQLEALDHLTVGDVIVSVPTGSGKTYVAIEAAKRAIEAERTVIYTSPLKALSNTKFTEFRKLFGNDQVGILTGDRKDNPQAPFLIMTTEILRNLLYDAAGGEIDVRLDTLGLVIMDESQYLADPERGVVWEETIIFCPIQSRLLLLSASIGNPEDLADWLTSIRPTPCRLVQHQKRTVPLRAGYLHPDGRLTSLFRTAGIPKQSRPPLHPLAKRLFSIYEKETLGNG